METRRYLLDCLQDMVAVHCTAQDGTLDSMGLSTHAEAMLALEEHGRVKITSERSAYRLLGLFLPRKGQPGRNPGGKGK